MSYNPLTATIPESVLSNARPGTNSTGFTIIRATPVKINADGSIGLVDPSIESDIDGLAGLTKDNVLDGSAIDVVSAGTLENITTLANVGDTLYLSKAGSLTNQKPSIAVAGFVAGDWIVRLGVIAKNQVNPLLKDLIVNIQFVGQL